MKIFLIGCGRILKKHLDSIKLLKNNLTIVGISDVNKKKLNYFSKKLKVEGFANYKKGINITKPDLVSILTPSGNHAEHIIDVLNLGKNIIVEKPMCLKISDGKKIIKLAKLRKKKVFVVMQNKFNLPVLKTWKLDGGVVSNQASHHLDLLRTIMGEPISVFAKSSKHLAKIQCEDTALIIFKFKNNKTAIMEATTAMRPYDVEGSLSILGTKGSAKVGGFALNKLEYYNLKTKQNLSRYDTNPKNVYGFGHVKFYKHVIDTIKSRRKSEFEADYAIKTVKLINAIYKSAEINKEVFFKKKITSNKLGK